MSTAANDAVPAAASSFHVNQIVWALPSTSPTAERFPAKIVAINEDDDDGEGEGTVLTIEWTDGKKVRNTVPLSWCRAELPTRRKRERKRPPAAVVAATVVDDLPSSHHAAADDGANGKGGGSGTKRGRTAAAASDEAAGDDSPCPKRSAGAAAAAATACSGRSWGPENAKENLFRMGILRGTAADDGARVRRKRPKLPTRGLRKGEDKVVDAVVSEAEVDPGRSDDSDDGDDDDGDDDSDSDEEEEEEDHAERSDDSDSVSDEDMRSSDGSDDDDDDDDDDDEEDAESSSVDLVDSNVDGGEVEDEEVVCIYTTRRSGETLASIARKIGTTPEHLLEQQDVHGDYQHLKKTTDKLTKGTSIHYRFLFMMIKGEEEEEGENCTSVGWHELYNGAWRLVCGVRRYSDGTRLLGRWSWGSSSSHDGHADGRRKEEGSILFEGKREGTKKSPGTYLAKAVGVDYETREPKLFAIRKNDEGGTERAEKAVLLAREAEARAKSLDDGGVDGSATCASAGVDEGAMEGATNRNAGGVARLAPLSLAAPSPDGDENCDTRVTTIARERPTLPKHILMQHGTDVDNVAASPPSRSSGGDGGNSAAAQQQLLPQHGNKKEYFGVIDFPPLGRWMSGKWKCEKRGCADEHCKDATHASFLLGACFRYTDELHFQWLELLKRKKGRADRAGSSGPDSLQFLVEPKREKEAMKAMRDGMEADTRRREEKCAGKETRWQTLELRPGQPVFYADPKSHPPHDEVREAIVISVHKKSHDVCYSLSLGWHEKCGEQGKAERTQRRLICKYPDAGHDAAYGNRETFTLSGGGNNTLANCIRPLGGYFEQISDDVVKADRLTWKASTRQPNNWSSPNFDWDQVADGDVKDRAVKLSREKAYSRRRRETDLDVDSARKVYEEVLERAVSLGDDEIIKPTLNGLRLHRRAINMLSVCGGYVPEVAAMKELGIEIGTVFVLETNINTLGVAIAQHEDIDFRVVALPPKKGTKTSAFDTAAERVIKGSCCGDVKRIREADIKKMSYDVGGIDLVLLSPPCQQLSMAGKKDGIGLYAEAGFIYDRVKKFNPNCFFLHEMTKTSDTIEEELEKFYHIGAVTVEGADMPGSGAARTRRIRQDFPLLPLYESGEKRRRGTLQESLDAAAKFRQEVGEPLLVKRYAADPTHQAHTLMHSKGLCQDTQVFEGTKSLTRVHLDILEMEHLMGVGFRGTERTFGEAAAVLVEEALEAAEANGGKKAGTVVRVGAAECKRLVEDAASDKDAAWKERHAALVVEDSERAAILGNSVSVCMYKYLLRWMAIYLFPKDGNSTDERLM